MERWEGMGSSIRNARATSFIGVLRSAFVPATAVFFALVVGALLIRAGGVDPLEAYRALWRGAFGSKIGITETFVKACPLWLTGLGVAFAFRCGVFNIGAEGQLFMGALATSWLGVSLGWLPSFALIPILVVAAMVGGGIWGGVAGFLKARFGANEIIVTIMMNYVAQWTMSWLLRSPLKDPSTYLPQTALLSPRAQLPILVSGTRFHGGIIIAALAAIALFVTMNATTLGFRVRVVGLSEGAARFAGINVPANVVLAMAISGALAGVAGMAEISGIHHRLLESFSPGYGYTAIVIALLGKLSPLGVMAAGLLFAALQVGANTMQRVTGIPAPLVSVIQGLVVLFVLVSDGQGTRRIVMTRVLKLRTAGRSLPTDVGDRA